jgi:2EXR family
MESQLPTPWITPATPPAVLYACRESRDEALRYYQLAFGRNGFEPRIYIDFTRDIVYFGRGTRGDGTLDVDHSMKDLEKIQYMAVTFNCMAGLLDWAICRRFTGLKDVYLVNLRTFSMRVPPRIKEIPSGSLSQTVASYSQKLEEQKDRFNSGIAPKLEVAYFVS